MFVPDDARAFLTGRIAAYGSEDLGNHERPDIDKFEVIEAIRAAAARTLVVGTPDLASPAMDWRRASRPHLRASSSMNLRVDARSMSISRSARSGS